MTDYQINALYPIQPFGSYPTSKTYEAFFVGYLQRRTASYGAFGATRFPVFKFDFYTYGDPTCLMVLEDGACVASGRTPTELIEAFTKLWSYYGPEWAMIKVGTLDVPRAEFIAQVRAAGLDQKQIDEALDRGSFSYRQGSKGEIKHCPTCKVIRQTSCNACGCGSCEVCGHRWSCSPPYIPSFETTIAGPLAWKLPGTGDATVLKLDVMRDSGGSAFSS